MFQKTSRVTSSGGTLSTRLPFADLGGQRRQDLVQVANDAVVRAAQEGGFAILVDDEDPFGALATDLMLNGPADSACERICGSAP